MYRSACNCPLALPPLTEDLAYNGYSVNVTWMGGWTAEHPSISNILCPKQDSSALPQLSSSFNAHLKLMNSSSQREPDWNSWTILNSPSSFLLWVLSQSCPTRSRIALRFSTPTAPVLGKALITACLIYPWTNGRPILSRTKSPLGIYSAAPILWPQFPHSCLSGFPTECSSLLSLPVFPLQHLLTTGCPVSTLAICISDDPPECFSWIFQLSKSHRTLNGTGTQ